MSQNNLELAKNLAMRPYLILKSREENTDGQPIFIARTLEIENCVGQGATSSEAEQDLRGALVDYIESLLDDGLFVPEPVQLVQTKGTGASTTVNLSNRGAQAEYVTVLDSYILTVNS